MRSGSVRYPAALKNQMDKGPSTIPSPYIPRFTRTWLLAVRKIQSNYSGIIRNNPLKFSRFQKLRPVLYRTLRASESITVHAKTPQECGLLI